MWNFGNVSNTLIHGLDFFENILRTVWKLKWLITQTMTFFNHPTPHTNFPKTTRFFPKFICWLNDDDHDNLSTQNGFLNYCIWIYNIIWVIYNVSTLLAIADFIMIWIGGDHFMLIMILLLTHFVNLFWFAFVNWVTLWFWNVVTIW